MSCRFRARLCVSFVSFDKVLSLSLKMVYCCCVVGCSNRRNGKGDLSFHSIPAVVETNGEQVATLSSHRRLKWLTNIKRDSWSPSKFSRVCSAHFISGKPAALFDYDDPDWAPTQNMAHNSAALGASTSRSRYLRLKVRKKKLQELSVAQALLESSVSTHLTEEQMESTVSRCLSKEQVDSSVSTSLDEEQMDSSVSTCLAKEQMESMVCTSVAKEQTESSCQTVLSLTDISELEKCLRNVEQDNMDLRETARKQGEQLKQKEMDEDYFKNNDDKVKFFTGLPSWTVFVSLLTLVSSALPDCRKLSKFSQVLMFFLKLRLNLFDEDIAYRFCVNQSTVSRNFHRVLDIMAVKVSSFIHWPRREALRLSIPTAFRKFFPKCAVILDCTEVFMERPSDLLARAQVWSNYKHHSTVKFLIGITPQGSICYLSKCWGGRVSDKEITENSDLMYKLLPGDLIIADRGFTVGDYCGMVMAEIRTPPFTHGKKQLAKVDVDWSRELSSVRIHVERIIGLVKQKYTVLQGTVPINFLRDMAARESTIDKIVHVCCSMVNLCPSVVPSE